MPAPNEGESRDDFVSRCVSIVLDDGAADDQDQAVAVCNSMWREANEEQDKMDKQMERKTFSGWVTKADEDQGIIEAFFAVFGNIDQGHDIIHPGAFTKTFLERGGKVRVLDNHRTDTIERAIGKVLLLKEIIRDKLPAELLMQNPEITGGAFARVQMLMDTPEGKGAFIRLRDGAIDEWSFGYDALDVDFSSAMKDGVEVNVRNLRTLRLYEISPVLFGMNEATTTVSAKRDSIDAVYDAIPEAWAAATTEEAMEILETVWASLSPKQRANLGLPKGVSGATNLPLADRDRAWDASAAGGRVRSHTGSEDEPSRAYRNAFFWFDGEATDNFGSYKLPFADVIGDRLTAIPRGIFAVAQRLDATDIPDSDKEGVRSRVSGYYAKMRQKFDDDSIVPPWDKAQHRPVENKAINLSQHVEDVFHAFYAQFPDVHNRNQNLHVIYWVKQIWDEFVIVEQEGTFGRRLWKIDYSVSENNINFLPQSSWVEVTMAFVPIAPADNTMQVASDNQNGKQAGPETPPTSNVLDEIQVLKLRTETLEVSYEEQGVART